MSFHPFAPSADALYLLMEDERAAVFQVCRICGELRLIKISERQVKGP